MYDTFRVLYVALLVACFVVCCNVVFCSFPPPFGDLNQLTKWQRLGTVARRLRLYNF